MARPESAPRWGGRIPKVAIVGGGLVLLLLIVVTTLSDDDGEAEVPSMAALSALPEPLVKADPVPDEPIIKELPKSCGISRKTARELTHGSGKPRDEAGESCWWYLSEGARNRDLTVRIDLNRDRPSPVDAALEAMAFPPVAFEGDPVKTVLGLGDEAWALYSPSVNRRGGATVRFRRGNAVVNVTYDAFDRHGDVRRQIPEKRAMEGALRAASEVAGALDAPDEPEIATPGEGPSASPIDRVPLPCDTVSPAMLKVVAPGAVREPATTSDLPATAAVSAETCEWAVHAYVDEEDEEENEDGGEREVWRRHVRVSIARLRETTAGRGMEEAARAYLIAHINAREEGEEKFQALRQPGDQAFVVYTEDETTEVPYARVIFRTRNVLASVTYHSGKAHDDEADPLTRGEAVKGAYTVARDIARAVGR